MAYFSDMAHVAQLVEHVLGKDEVTRSIRVVGSMPRLIRPGAHMIALGNRIGTSSVDCSTRSAKHVRDGSTTPCREEKE
jgi:hypothetical protein